MQAVLDGPLELPDFTLEEMAVLMERLRQEEKDAEKAELAEALALPVPACLQELDGKSDDELRRIFEDIFAKVAAEDVPQGESMTVGRADDGSAGEDAGASFAAAASNADGSAAEASGTIGFAIDASATAAEETAWSGPMQEGDGDADSEAAAPVGSGDETRDAAAAAANARLEPGGEPAALLVPETPVEAHADRMEEGDATEDEAEADPLAAVSETERSGDGSSDAAASGPSGAAAPDDGDGHSEAAGTRAATAAGSSAQLRPGRCQIAWHNQVPLEDVVNGNVIVKQKTRYKQCGTSVIRQLSVKVCEQQGGVCKGCGAKKFEIKEGKVKEAHLDHIFPASLVGVCPLQAARTDEARLAVALDENVMQLLRESAHHAIRSRPTRTISWLRRRRCRRCSGGCSKCPCRGPWTG